MRAASPSCRKISKRARFWHPCAHKSGLISYCILTKVLEIRWGVALPPESFCIVLLVLVTQHGQTGIHIMSILTAQHVTMAHFAWLCTVRRFRGPPLERG